MMSQPAASTMPQSAAIIGPQYRVLQQMDIAIVRKVMSSTDGSFVVTDANDNILFKVKGRFFSIHNRRVLVDAAENPLVTLTEKIMTAHERWQAFTGDSTDPRDLIFTVRRSSMIQLKTKLHVFLSTNTTNERVCDFRIEGSWLERSCVVYAGESNNIVAQMHKKLSVRSVLLGKDKFMVTVYPNVDYAFIAAIIVILDAYSNIIFKCARAGKLIKKSLILAGI